MKLKILLLIPLTFLLVACPSEENDIYLTINSFTVQDSCFNNENEFKIYLDFRSSEIAQSTSFSSNIGVAYASYEPFIYLKNKVEKCTITNTKEFNNLAVNTEISNYFELSIDNSEWINELSLVEGINESIKLQYNKNERPYLKLKHNSSLDYSGAFIIELELSDGTLLSDSTQNVIINITE